MTRILFVCHGNICRSPMAEYRMKDMVSKAGLTEEFEIASAATSREELGNIGYENGECAQHSPHSLCRGFYLSFFVLLIYFPSAWRRGPCKRSFALLWRTHKAHQPYFFSSFLCSGDTVCFRLPRYGSSRSMVGSNQSALSLAH